MNYGKKRKPQKHQNKTAFKIKFDTKALDTQKKVSLHLYDLHLFQAVRQMPWTAIMET